MNFISICNEVIDNFFNKNNIQVYISFNNLSGRYNYFNVVNQKRVSTDNGLGIYDYLSIYSTLNDEELTNEKLNKLFILN